ncbi:MAG: DNA internalization-related competence protein ComEC/Rec2 [Clostridia bacterium]|nr:DNA internalization-related competence protein ComEC/Rec2 [Clostridia bacterium]
MEILRFDGRPMLLLGAAAVCGIYMATGGSPWTALVLVLILLAGAWIFGTSRKYIAAAVAAVLIFWVYGQVYEKILDESYSQFAGKECIITGTVSSVEASGGEYTLLSIKPAGPTGRKIKAYLFDCGFEYMQGDRIRIKGTIRKPGPAVNPGGYDARKMMYADGMTAMIFANNGDASYMDGFTPGKIFGFARRDITRTCMDLLGADNGGILAGMMIGDKSYLDPETKTEFRDSGLSHTMAVSGSHVAYLLGPLMFIFAKAGIERRKYYPWLMAILALFAMLAGLQPSVLRASLTASVMLTAGMLSRETDSLNSLAFSALVLLAVNPFALYDAGFILSYACVLSILLFHKPLAARLGRGAYADILGMTIAVQIGILPVTAKLFYTVQIFSIISNMLIFPVRAVLAVSGWLMYFLNKLLPPLAGLAAVPVGWLTSSIASVAELFGASGMSVVSVPFIPAWAVAVYYIAFYVILHYPKYSLHAASSIAAAAALCIGIFSFSADLCVFFDSGQADCFLIKSARGDILIDTGGHALGSPIAHFCGDYIDAIFISHAHEDHTGGLSDILERFRVGVVYIPGGRFTEMEEIADMCKRYDVACRTLLAGGRLNAGGYVIEVLNPMDKCYLSLNDTSLVLKLTCGQNTMLFCGDAGIPAEMDMMSRAESLDADIFKVPHHGAGNAAYEKFFSAVSPEISVISCGLNYFGHPSSETLGLLRDSTVFRTDMDGAVIIRMTRGGYKVKTVKK